MHCKKANLFSLGHLKGYKMKNFLRLCIFHITFGGNMTILTWKIFIEFIIPRFDSAVKRVPKLRFELVPFLFWAYFYMDWRWLTNMHNMELSFLNSFWQNFFNFKLITDSRVSCQNIWLRLQAILFIFRMWKIC